jgi:UDP-glucose 4-epimerase
MRRHDQPGLPRAQANRSEAHLPDLPSAGTRVLVTGGAGFIGSAVVSRLLAGGCEVAVVDNLTAGTRRSLPSEWTTHFTFFEQDLVDRTGLQQIVFEFEPEACVHLAAVHFIPQCTAHPAATIETNVLGTQNLIDALLATGRCARVVFASTADVYQADLSAHDENAALSPNNIYGVSKLCCEQLLRIASSGGRLTPVVARLFNVYGPGETNPHILPEMVDQLLVGSELVLGNLTPRRDYVFVEDVADVLVALTASTSDMSLVNVGTGRSLSVSDLVEIASALLDRPLTMSQDPKRTRQIDRPNLQADVRRLRRVFPWATRTTFEAGFHSLLEDAGICPLKSTGQNPAIGEFALLQPR